MRPEDEAWFRNDGSYKYKDDTHKTVKKIAGSQSEVIAEFFHNVCQIGPHLFISNDQIAKAFHTWHAQGERVEVGPRQVIGGIVALGKGQIRRVKTHGIRGLRGVALGVDKG